jgi:hypothetical protein
MCYHGLGSSSFVPVQTVMAHTVDSPIGYLCQQQVWDGAEHQAQETPRRLQVGN